MCADLRALVRPLLTAADACLIEYTALHKGTTKLLYILTRVFRTLLSRGLCTPVSAREEASGGGDDGGPQQELDGGDGGEDGANDATGMGDAPLSGGEKDVSELIEDEEQLLGLKQDGDAAEPPPPDDKELGKDEADEGIEMSNDFSGELFDVPEDQAENAGEDEGEDDAEELDREMGEAGEEAEAVDEKMWGEDDDDKDTNEDRRESDELGERLDGAPLEDEIRAWRPMGRTTKKEKIARARSQMQPRARSPKRKPATKITTTTRTATPRAMARPTIRKAPKQVAIQARPKRLR